MGDKWKQIKDD